MNRLTVDKSGDQQFQVVLSCYSLDLTEYLLQSIMWLFPWIYPLLLHPRPLNKFVKIQTISSISGMLEPSPWGPQSSQVLCPPIQITAFNKASENWGKRIW